MFSALYIDFLSIQQFTSKILPLTYKALRAFWAKYIPDYITGIGSIPLMKSQMVPIIFSLEDEESNVFFQKEAEFWRARPQPSFSLPCSILKKLKNAAGSLDETTATDCARLPWEYAVWMQQMCQSSSCVYLQRQVNFSFRKTSHRGSPQFLHGAEGHCKKKQNKCSSAKKTQ